MIEVRPSEARGPADHGWLQSRHSFSFGGYYDPKYMGVSDLRVINDDKVAAGAGFATHSHQDMEIISYVKRGTIEHKDSMGNVERLPAGEFQLMTAGTGVTHSEYNSSATDSLEFLQIWIQPNQLGIEPGYQQKRFEPLSGLQLIASPDARDGSLLLHQEASLYQLFLQPGATATHTLGAQRIAYLHVVSGIVVINGEQLYEGDGATITEIDSILFEAVESAEALLFDLARVG
jgi:redox-sensitive bicupin YhaK (pirin superfamily)